MIWPSCPLVNVTSVYLLQRGWKLEVGQRRFFGSGSFVSWAMPTLAPALLMVSRLDPVPLHISAREGSLWGWCTYSQSTFTLWAELWWVCSLKFHGDKLFSRAYYDRTRGNSFKLKEGRIRLDIRQKIFIMGVVKCSNRLPREVVGAPSLKHSSLGWMELWATWSSWTCLCLLQGGWTRWPLKVPSNPSYSMILWF